MHIGTQGIMCIVCTMCTEGGSGSTVCTVCSKGAQGAQCARRPQVSVHATSFSMCPEQAVPNLTTPRVYRLVNKLIFGYLILRKSVFVPVLPRLQNGSGSSRQVRTWSNCPFTSIVLDSSVCAEIGHLFLVLRSNKDGPLE